MTSDYTLIASPPDIHDYCRLREVTGLSPRSKQSAAIGLPNTFYGVTIIHDGIAIGMGRIIGDGALFFQIVDIAVDPAHQGKGLGKIIMGALTEYLSKTLESEAYISLIADGKANELYRQFGFEDTLPASRGMAMWLNKE